MGAHFFGLGKSHSFMPSGDHDDLPYEKREIFENFYSTEGKLGLSEVAYGKP